MKSKKSVSSRDVAREAGVSQATVSYILNDVKNVKIKPETRAAVLDAVKKLNYHPNQIARGMKLKKSMSLGVVTDRNVTNFYFMKTLEGIRDGIQQHNYSITLLLNKSDDIVDSEFMKYYNSNRIDGIIFAFASMDDDTINYLNEKGVPYIIADAQKSGRDVYEVCTDHLNHISEIIEYFKSKGALRIGYAGPSPKNIGDGRLQAYKEALTAHGLKVENQLIAASDFDDNNITRVITQLLSGEQRPQAILAGSPRYGLLTVKCAQNLGIRVPEELRVIAFGTSNFYTVAHPSLSAVELPLYEMGLRSAEMLFDLMNGHEPQKTVILSSELVLRDSS